MTLEQACTRFPLVPIEIIQWALDNIPDPASVECGLQRLEFSRRMELKYTS